MQGGLLNRGARQLRDGETMQDAAARALAFVAAQGVVLATAKGRAARLIDAIAGEPIAGNWWSHPRANEIFSVLSAVGESPDVLVCRLVDGKITFVHRSVWPALVRVADRFRPEQLAQVRNEHTASGRHASHAVAFPEWVPRETLAEGARLAEADALAALAPWLDPAPNPSRRDRRSSAAAPSR